jgi:hypothetical protein
VPGHHSRRNRTCRGAGLIAAGMWSVLGLWRVDSVFLVKRCTSFQSLHWITAIKNNTHWKIGSPTTKTC